MGKLTDRVAQGVNGTIDFSEVLMGLKPKRHYFVTGTPCVIRGIRRPVAKHPRYADVNVYTCALVCSHNATSLLADYLADRHRIPESSRYAVDFRDKDGIPDAGEYNTRYYDTGDRALDRDWFVKTVNEGKEAARKRKDRFLRYVDCILESTT